MAMLWKNESKAFGYKVTHSLIHPTMCVVGVEVGGNIFMQDDGYIGGTRLLCERGTVLQKQSSNKDNDYTVMGFTLLSRESLICILT